MQNLRRPKFEKICGGRIYEGGTNRYICEASILKLPTTVTPPEGDKKRDLPPDAGEWTIQNIDTLRHSKGPRSTSSIRAGRSTRAYCAFLMSVGVNV